MSNIQYKCRAPFMSRVGQFEPGKSTLVCGILASVIMKGGTSFSMQLGDSPTVYTVTFDKLREAPHSVWKNPKGKPVWIVPVSVFTRKEGEKVLPPSEREIPADPQNKLF